MEISTDVDHYLSPNSTELVYCPTCSVFHKTEVQPPQNHLNPFQNRNNARLVLITNIVRKIIVIAITCINKFNSALFRKQILNQYRL